MRGAGLALVAGLADGLGVADASMPPGWPAPAPCPVPCPVQFVPQHSLPPGEAYEAFIRRTGLVPTRDNLHDLFNGLVWQRFPRAKARG